jgi:hypothetical protein
MFFYYGNSFNYRIIIYLNIKWINYIFIYIFINQLISILCGLYYIYTTNDKYYKTIIKFIAILFDDKYLANLYFYLI